ncbi:hypothetical protein F4778DRAFT_730982, partial [Xylariomycetidae sp. FL2044]
MCYALSNGHKVNFRIERTGDDSVNIDKTTCVNRLKQEIEGCDKGGESNSNGWKV